MPQDAPESAHSTPIPDELLRVLHDSAAGWLGSEHVVLRAWAHHLLEDWRSLELLAERYRD